MNILSIQGREGKHDTVDTLMNEEGFMKYCIRVSNSSVKSKPTSRWFLLSTGIL